MNKKNFWVLPVAMLFSFAVYAGYAQPAPVMIELYEGGGTAQGDMSSARHDDNEFAFIGCGIRAFDDGAGGVYNWGFCQASLEEEGTVTCFTDDNAELMEGINILSDSSFITFSWSDDGEGNLSCTRVGSSTQSFYLLSGKDAKK